MAKVLLVEDDNNLREIYQARLAAEGYDIVAAQNGEEALVVAKQNKPDLVISDVMMPRISGFEMLDILRNTDELKDTKVIMLTALGQAEDQTRANNLGADKYLVKSQVTLEDIVNCAKELLGETPLPAPGDQAGAATPVTPIVEETPVVEAPAEPVAAANPDLPPAVAPVASEPVVPASVAPQPDTTVVVPPAPADPTPPTVTVAPLPTAAPEPADASASPAAVSAEPVAPSPDPAPAAAALATPPVVSEPVVAPPVIDSAAATNASQPLETEEADVEAQIKDFVNQDTPPPAAVEPAPAVSSNDQTMAEAVEELNDTATPPVERVITVAVQPAEAPAPAEPLAETPEPAPAVPNGPIPTSVGGTKVIQPINDVSSQGPNLNELLAKEEAKEAASQPLPTAAPGTTAAAPPSTPNANAGLDPNNVAL